MPNLYYCSTVGQGSGILRAVLSWGDTQNLLRMHPAHYFGRRFPNQHLDCAVLHISESEGCEYRPGFYCFDNANIIQIEDCLRSFTSARSPMEATQPDMKRPVKIPPVMNPSINQSAGSLRGSLLLALEPLRKWLNKPWPHRVVTRR